MTLRLETSIAAPDGEQYAGRTQARTHIAHIAARVRAIEALGFDGLNASESGHDPYLPLMLAAEHTQRIRIGTNVATAFPRSPMATAQAAWDLQALSGGRFALGLGTQIKRHNEQRYGVPWVGSPVARMREYLRCLRAIFASFQDPGQPTWFEGTHYRFTMLPPFFNPGPIAHSHIPIHLAVANVHMSRLAGELCEGARLHPIATFRYTREEILPAIEAGAARGNRKREDFELIGSPFLAIGRDEAELEAARNTLRQQIAFYAATRSYHPVLAHHGWEEIGLRLNALSLAGRWQEMPALISDEMLDEWAVIATRDTFAERLRARCEGLFDTVALVLLGPLREDEAFLRDTVHRIHSNGAPGLPLPQDATVTP